MAQPAFLARDFTANPVEANPASAPVVPAFGGSSPASYVSTYVPSYATKWVEALQGQLTSLMSGIQDVFSEVDGRLAPLENNDAGYQDAGQVSQAVNDGLVGYATENFVSNELLSYDTASQVDLKINTATADMATNATVASDIASALVSYDDSAVVDSKITTATNGMATNTSVAADISNALASYDDATAVDGKISTAINGLIAGAPANLDTLNEIATAYAAADSSLQGLIDANSGDLATAQTDIADAVARIAALEQLVNDLHSSTYGQ